MPTTIASPTSTLAVDWDALIDEVANYLTANQGSTDCLAALFQHWDMPSDGTTSCVAADLDGDPEDEYVVRLVRKPAVGEGSGYFPNWLLGKILVFDGSDEGFGPVFELNDFGPTRYEERLSENPVIYLVKDVNGDARSELFLTTSECGAHTCHLNVYALTNRGDNYVSIVEESAAGPSILVPMADDQLRIEDIDGDGTAEILLRQGMIASVGAGPQREATRTYRLVGGEYVLNAVDYDRSDLRYFKIRDADDALGRRAPEQALPLYEAALTDAGLRDVDYFGDPRELLAYARFKIGVSLAALDDASGALVALDEAVAADQDAVHSQLAVRFHDAYAAAADISAGCDAALAFVDKNAETFKDLWYYGYANPNLGAETWHLCPFGPRAQSTAAP